MKDHHTSQHLHVILADTDTKDCHLKQPLQEICSKVFKDLPNVFGFADDILVVGYGADSKDHNADYKKHCKDADRLI